MARKEITVSEVHRYQVVTMLSAAGATIGYDPHGPDVVMAADYDRVAAERDALLRREVLAKEQIDEHLSVVRDQRTKIDALQALLTAADERADVLDGLIGEVLDAVGREPLDLDAVLRLRARMRAALKPAEVGADSCEFCKGWGFRSNPDGADEGCGACNGTGKEPSDDQQ